MASGSAAKEREREREREGGDNVSRIARRHAAKREYKKAPRTLPRDHAVKNFPPEFFLRFRRASRGGWVRTPSGNPTYELG